MLRGAKNPLQKCIDFSCGRFIASAASKRYRQNEYGGCSRLPTAAKASQASSNSLCCRKSTASSRLPFSLRAKEDRAASLLSGNGPKSASARTSSASVLGHVSTNRAMNTPYGFLATPSGHAVTIPSPSRSTEIDNNDNDYTLNPTTAKKVFTACRRPTTRVVGTVISDRLDTTYHFIVGNMGRKLRLSGDAPPGTTCYGALAGSDNCARPGGSGVPRRLKS